MTAAPMPPPTDVAAFLHRITAEYEQLSRQLKLIARHVEAHRDHLGLEGIQDVAAQCGVQPSAVVRFAKHFGFSGFTEMQRLFRQGLSEQIAPSRNYSRRLRDVIESGSGSLSEAEIAHEFLRGSIAGMQELQQSLDEHRAILASMLSGDAAKSEKLMLDHIQSGREALARMDSQATKGS